MSSRVQQKAAARARREELEARERRAVQRRRSLITLATVTVAALSVVATLIYVARPESASTPAAGAQASADVASRLAGLPQDGITLGAPSAGATLIEYADLQCPFCAEFSRDVLPTVIEQYVRPGKLKLELGVLTFVGDDSVEAGQMAAAAAQQDRLWHFADAFYLAQGQENTGYVTDDFLRSVGATAGLDVDAAMAARETPETQKLLDDAQARAQEHGVDSTPSFLLRRGDGEVVPVTPEELTVEAFTKALDEALAP
jgi:protein-disulfide isomerase